MELDWLSVLLRWLHIVAAVLLAGGALFWCCVLRPAASELDDATAAGLRQRVAARFSKIVMLAILLLLVSGLINFININRSLPADANKMLYHGLFGIKFLLALVVFFLASALSGRSAAFEKLRANAKTWLSLTSTLAVAIILISGVMRVYRDGAYTGQAPDVPNVNAPADDAATGDDAPDRGGANSGAADGGSADGSVDLGPANE